MGYPNSVYNPPARSNGQVIDQAWFNDPQNELTAIETALLGTITHSINVSGASTIASLQAGASTFTVRPVMPPPDFARVYLESSVTLGSSAASTIAWTSQDILTNSSAHSTASNPERLTPQSTGVYQFAAQISFTFNSTGARSVSIRDSSNADYGQTRVSASTAEGVVLNVTGYKRFDALGGYMRCVVLLSGNSTLSVVHGVQDSWFAMHKL